MKYTFAKSLVLISFAFGLVATVSSFPPAMAEVSPMTNTVAQLPGIAISQYDVTQALLGVIGLLLAGFMWWIIRYITTNDAKHELHFKRSDKLTESLHVTALSLERLTGDYQATKERM